MNENETTCGFCNVEMLQEKTDKQGDIHFRCPKCKRKMISAEPRDEQYSEEQYARALQDAGCIPPNGYCFGDYSHDEVIGGRTWKVWFLHPR